MALGMPCSKPLYNENNEEINGVSYLLRMEAVGSINNKKYLPLIPTNIPIRDLYFFCLDLTPSWFTVV